VIAGTYDDNIRHLAQWVQKTDRPVYLRIGYEFDLPANKYAPEKYQQAFRHIVDIFRELKIDNVAFVWHSYAGYVDGSRMRWYPGDKYVDWFAISFFDAYNDANYDVFAKVAREHGKPLMIAEATPRGMSTSDGQKVWDTWYKRFFEFVRRHDVRVISYINAHWDAQPMFRGQGWGDARIQQSEYILGEWRKEVGQGRYLVSGLMMYGQLGYKQK
jgi:beta-mannanase